MSEPSTQSSMFIRLKAGLSRVFHTPGLDDTRVFDGVMEKIDGFEKESRFGTAKDALSELSTKYQRALESSRAALVVLNGYKKTSPRKIREVTKKIEILAAYHASIIERIADIEEKILSFREPIDPTEIDIRDVGGVISRIPHLISKARVYWKNYKIQKSLAPKPSVDPLKKALSWVEAPVVAPVNTPVEVPSPAVAPVATPVNVPVPVEKKESQKESPEAASTPAPEVALVNTSVFHRIKMGFMKVFRLAVLEDLKVFSAAMKKVDAFEKEYNFSAAKNALTELSLKYRYALDRSESALEVLKGREGVAPEEISDIEGKIETARKRYNSVNERLVEIEKKAASFDRYEHPDTATIADFKDAIKQISRLISKKDLDTANLAIHEILLKHKTAMNYGEALIRKLHMLQISNVMEVSKAAKKRVKDTEKTMKVLEDRIRTIDKMKNSLEVELAKKQTRERTKKQKEEFERSIADIEHSMKNGKYSIAITAARRLLADNPNNPVAVKVFKKAEKLFAQKMKEEKKGRDSRNDVELLLKEAGVQLTGEVLHETTLTDLLKSRIRIWLHKARDYVVLVREEERRKRAFQDIEKLLIKHNGVGSISMNAGDFSDSISATRAGFVRDLSSFKLSGFDFFGRIQGKDEVTGDAFGFHEYKEEGRTVFYVGDATGHGIQASFTVAVTSKIFFEVTQNSVPLQEIVMTVNNELKKKIQGRYFMTGVFFEWDSKNCKMRFIGGGHDPLYVYHKNTKTIEKVIPGGLAIGVRAINNIESLKVREIAFEDGDVLFAYTDGIIECRNPQGEIYGLSRIENLFARVADMRHSPHMIYDEILAEIEEFQDGCVFDDDVSIYVFRRDVSKDSIDDYEGIRAILAEMKTSEKDMKLRKLKSKTREEIVEIINKQRHEAELKIRISKLQQLDDLGEFFKMKQEAIRYFKEGFVSSKLKWFLERAIVNEQKFTLKKQDERVARRYKTLLELYKKWQYDLVIKESLEVIAKNGKI